MKQEIKEKWLKALRGGEYKQGMGALNCNGKMCCLGVLSDLYAKENNIEWDDSIRGTPNKCILNQEEILPDKVKEWADLNDWNPFVTHGNTWRRLASINDDGGTFVEIADLIEKQL